MDRGLPREMLIPKAPAYKQSELPSEFPSFEDS